MKERYNFEWSQYHLQSKTLLQNIYERSDFHDVTLVTDDERFIKSHKVVLAASSGYFQKVLSYQQHPHTLLVLKGVSGHVLDWILKFIYAGETSVDQSNVEEFIQTCRYLKINGIEEEHGKNEEGKGKQKTHPKPKNIVDIVDEAAKSFRLEENNEDSNDSTSSFTTNEDSNDSATEVADSSKDFSNIQELLIQNQNEHIEINLEDDEMDETTDNKNTSNDIETIDDVEEIEVISEDKTNKEIEPEEEELEDDKLFCDLCDYETTSAENYRIHISVNHVNDVFCKSCDFRASDKHKLKKHMIDSHNGVACNNCKKKFSDLTLMRKHILANENCMANLF